MRGRLKSCRCERTLDEQLHHCVSSIKCIFSLEMYAYCRMMRNVLVVGVGIRQLPTIWLYKSKVLSVFDFWHNSAIQVCKHKW